MKGVFKLGTLYDDEVKTLLQRLIFTIFTKSTIYIPI